MMHELSNGAHSFPRAVITRSPRRSTGPEINEQDPIFVVIDDLPRRVPAADDVARRELALEDRVLEVIAEPAHGFVDLGEAAVVADV